MSKTRKLGSNIPKDALIFEVNGVKYRRGETKHEGNLFICQVKNLNTGEWTDRVPFNKIEKYLKY